MADFSNYELDAIASRRRGVYELGDRLLPEIAEVLDHDIGEVPSEESFKSIIGQFAPDKEAQRNIGLVKDIVSVDQAADWVERAGVLKPVARAFRDATPLPEAFDAAIFSGGVANWLLRRTAVLERFDPRAVRRVYLVAGDRRMGDSEHQLVRSHRNNFGEHGVQTTEATFMRRFIVPRLDSVWFDTRLHHDEVEKDAIKILAGFFEHPASLGLASFSSKILVPTNAPNSVQAAFQMRRAIQSVNPGFDRQEEPQLFMVSDTIPVARNGEPSVSHQDPYPAVGQILRSAKYLHNAVTADAEYQETKRTAF